MNELVAKSSFLRQFLTASQRVGQRFSWLDRVWLAFAVIVILVGLLEPSAVISVLQFTAKSFLEVLPFLALSVAIAAYAMATGADNLIAQVFTGQPVKMILVAAAFGALSPFCSCGVIPLIAALLAMGVPIAPVMAFWLASPVIDPSMFALTVGLLGMDYAIAKLLAAIWLGLMGGFVTHFLVGRGFMASPLREALATGGCAASSMTAPKPIAWAFWRDSARVEKFRRSALGNTLFLGKWLALAFLLEALMLRYVPPEWVASVLGGEGVWPVVAATLIGVPAYLNGYAALPLVSGLIEQGMSPGAGLSFLVAGGVSSIPAAIAVFALVKRQVFALYMVFALFGSLAAGLAFHSWTV